MPKITQLFFQPEERRKVMNKRGKRIKYETDDKEALERVTKFDNWIEDKPLFTPPKSLSENMDKTFNPFTVPRQLQNRENEEMLNKLQEQDDLNNMVQLKDVYGDGVDTPTPFLEKKEIKKPTEEGYYLEGQRPQLTLMNEIINQINSEISHSLARKRDFEKSRSKSKFPKWETDMGSNIMGLLNLKMNAVKTLDTMQKNKADYELKLLKETGVASEEAAMDETKILTQIYSQIMNNRKDVIEDVMEPEILTPDQYNYERTMYQANSDEYIESGNYSELLSPSEDDYDSNDLDMLKSRERELVKTGDIKYNEYEMSMKYENSVSLDIYKNKETGKWRFVAMNRDTGMEVEDYPLPSKKSCGNMKFDDDRCTAIDSLGKTYVVYYE